MTVQNTLNDLNMLNAPSIRPIGQQMSHLWSWMTHGWWIRSRWGSVQPVNMAKDPCIRHYQRRNPPIPRSVVTWKSVVISQKLGKNRHNGKLTPYKVSNRAEKLKLLPATTLQFSQNKERLPTHGNILQQPLDTRLADHIWQGQGSGAPSPDWIAGSPVGVAGGTKKDALYDKRVRIASTP